MPSRDERRNNRARILKALHDETGSYGGGQAENRVRAYINNPVGATTQEFGYVGGLSLKRFYIDPSKPNASERRSLWQNISNRIESVGRDPGGWSESTRVLILQAIVEGTIS